MTTKHRRQIESTNAGHYFSECSCGWSGGVYYGRSAAIFAHDAHRLGYPLPSPVRPTVTITERTTP